MVIPLTAKYLKAKKNIVKFFTAYILGIQYSFFLMILWPKIGVLEDIFSYSVTLIF